MKGITCLAIRDPVTTPVGLSRTCHPNGLLTVQGFYAERRRRTVQRIDKGEYPAPRLMTATEAMKEQQRLSQLGSSETMTFVVPRSESVELEFMLPLNEKGISSKLMIMAMHRDRRIEYRN